MNLHLDGLEALGCLLLLPDKGLTDGDELGTLVDLLVFVFVGLLVVVGLADDQSLVGLLVGLADDQSLVGLLVGFAEGDGEGASVLLHQDPHHFVGDALGLLVGFAEG